MENVIYHVYRYMYYCEEGCTAKGVQGFPLQTVSIQGLETHTCYDHCICIPHFPFRLQDKTELEASVRTTHQTSIRQHTKPVSDNTPRTVHQSSIKTAHKNLVSGCNMHKISMRIHIFEGSKLEPLISNRKTQVISDVICFGFQRSKQY